MSDERIERAAIMFDGEVWAVPAPGRHCDVIRKYCRENKLGSVPPKPECTSVQGFLTNECRFVDREEAVAVARRAGQIGETKRTRPAHMLFSEDLW